MTTFAEDVQNLMTDYRDRIKAGEDYNPDPEDLIARYAERRGLLPRKDKRDDYQRAFRACLDGLLKPFQDRISEAQFVRDYMLGLARRAHEQWKVGQPKERLVVDGAWKAELAARYGVSDRCDEIICSEEAKLNASIRRAVQNDQQARAELADMLVVWLRPHLSRIISDDVRKIYGTTGDLVSDWYILAAKGFDRFPIGDYSEEGVHAHFLSFMVSRAWLAKKQSDRKTGALKRVWNVLLSTVLVAPPARQRMENGCADWPLPSGHGTTSVAAERCDGRLQLAGENDAEPASSGADQPIQELPGPVPTVKLLTEVGGLTPEEARSRISELSATAVYQAIQRLAEPEERTAMLLTKVGGLSLEEAGERMTPQKTVNAMKNILRNARRKLKSNLDDNP